MFSYKDLTLDHVILKSKGGVLTWENTVTACRKCNNQKANHTNIKPYRIPKAMSAYFKLKCKSNNFA